MVTLSPSGSCRHRPTSSEGSSRHYRLRRRGLPGAASSSGTTRASGCVASAMTTLSGALELRLHYDNAYLIRMRPEVQVLPGPPPT
jgi:hypothetical protein